MGIANLLARVISKFNALIFLSLSDKESMDGRAFSLRKRFDVLTGGVLNIIIDPTAVTKQNVVLLPVGFDAHGGPFNIDIYFGVTESGDGTPLYLFNRSISLIATPPQTAISYDPVTVDTGVIVPAEFLVPSNGLPATSTTGASGGESLVLNMDITKKTLIRLTNTDTVTSSIGIKIDFFEVE